jgi:hypothetical protein
MTKLDVYEVRPGVFLRLRAHEAARFGYVPASVKHKAAAPSKAKGKKKAAPVEDDETTEGGE